jgi:hypothetical protein
MNLNLFFAFPTKSQLGFLSLDILVTENLKLPSEVTKYPVEDGSEEISDHITQNNEELSITGRIANTEILSFQFGPGITKLVDAVGQLRSMHKARQPVKVVTGLGTYTDMAFTNLAINRSNGTDGGYWLDINAELRKLKKVAIKTTELPPDKASDTDGANKKTGVTEKKGDTSGNWDTAPKDQSMLKGLQNQINTNKPFGLTIPKGSFALPGSP